ncbi:DMT family transporter [Breznakiellaceae bacterium SP9]
MNPNHKSRLIGECTVILAAALWSSSGLFIKLLDWHPFVIAGVRSFIAALFLLIVRQLFSRFRHGKNNRPFLITGGLAYAATMITYVYANKLTSSANAILLQYSAPIWAAILSWIILREKPHWEHWAALAMVMGGLVLFFKDSMGDGHIVGDCLSVLSGICFGLNSVCMRKQKDANPQDTLLFSHLACAACSIPLIFLYPPALTISSVSVMLFMGFVQMGLASFLFSYSIKKVSAIQAMLCAMIEPILNPIWVLIFTSEQPTLNTLIGGGIIIFAVIFASVVGRKR